MYKLELTFSCCSPKRRQFITKETIMQKIILDCDPGHDDAIAILLAAGNPNIDLLGITTVSGNHNVENTTRNALAVCTAYGIKVSVAKGAAGPLTIELVLAAEVHGSTGLEFHGRLREQCYPTLR